MCECVSGRGGCGSRFVSTPYPRSCRAKRHWCRTCNEFNAEWWLRLWEWLYDVSGKIHVRSYPAVFRFAYNHSSVISCGVSVSPLFSSSECSLLTVLAVLLELPSCLYVFQHF